jgi:4-amino-4-deoxy-L-arabinose transferase-like glycosyltransferase
VTEAWVARWLRPDQHSARDVRLDLIWLLALGAILIATGIGLREPWPADEPRFALVARDMVATGDWLIPKVGGELYADKPPLYFWLLAVAFTLTGSTRASFLLPSLLAAGVTVALIYDLARRLWNRQTALIAATLLLLTVQFVTQARRAQIDATLCMWTTLSLYGLLRHLFLGPRWRWYIVGWAAAGLGVITKGVGFLPLLVLLPWFVLQRRWSIPAIGGGILRWLSGPIAFAAAICVWLVPILMLAADDPALAAYRDEILFKQTIERYAQAWHHLEPFWYFLIEVIPVFWLPLIVLLPWLVPRWREAIRQRDIRVTTLLTWVAMVVLFFSASEGKRGVYVLPAVPAFVLACAPFTLDILRKTRARMTMLGITSVLAIAGIAGAIYTFVLPDTRHQFLATYGLDVLPVLAIIGCIASVLTFWCRRVPLAAFAGVLTTLILAASFMIFPAIDDERSSQAFLARVEQHANPAYELGILSFKEQYLLQIRRPIVHFGHRRWNEEAQEAADGALWLNAQPDRQLLITETARRRCFANVSAQPLGIANRIEWFLIRGPVSSPCTAQGVDSARRYVPPDLASPREFRSKLLSNDSHQLRADPSGVSS